MASRKESDSEISVDFADIWLDLLGIGFTLDKREPFVEIKSSNGVVFVVGRNRIDELIAMLIRFTHELDKMKTPKKAD